MRITVTQVDRWKGKLTIVPRFSGAVTAPPHPPGGEVPAELGAACLAPDDSHGRQTVLISAGKRAEFDSERMRRIGGAAAKWMRTWRIDRAGFDVSGNDVFSSIDSVIALCEGLHLAGFTFERHKRGERRPGPSHVDILMARPNAAAQSAVRRAQSVCAATNLARELSHEPPNILNPVTLARGAQGLARRAGLACRVLDHRLMARLKMGGILSAGSGSATPPRLIVLEHRGRAVKGRAKKPVVLVGKAVTFDTGGYSLKTKDAIVGMKYDKCGGMAVLGVMQAVAAAKFPHPVVGVIAAAENMVSAEAYRPDDIVTTLSGKTVQIVSADAEGRMVLCDALTWAQREYRPRCIIDLATLTGGIVVALGYVAGGVFSNDEALERALIESGRRTFERLWPLPMWDDYCTLIKGDDSDLKNSAGRDAHAICGAIFLKQFVDPNTPWAHLDIAGVAHVDSDQPYCPKGATGFGVRLLMDYLEHI